MDSSLSYEPALMADFDALADLRVAAMRESLEALGRFDPERARRRLRQTFDPACTWHIARDGERVGFYVIGDEGDHWMLRHLYLHPVNSGQGLGAGVMRHIVRLADGAGKPLRVGALRGSRSNGFYLAHGFVLTHEDEWDLYYERGVGA
jgi:GNAT superfamily N-acetyltransferase